MVRSSGFDVATLRDNESGQREKYVYGIVKYYNNTTINHRGGLHGWACSDGAQYISEASEAICLW